MIAGGPVSTTSVKMFSGFSFEENARASRYLFPSIAQYRFSKQLSPLGRRWWRGHRKCITSSSVLLLTPEGLPRSPGKERHSSSRRKAVLSEADSCLPWPWSAGEGWHPLGTAGGWERRETGCQPTPPPLSGVCASPVMHHTPFTTICCISNYQRIGN